MHGLAEKFREDSIDHKSCGVSRHNCRFTQRVNGGDGGRKSLIRGFFCAHNLHQGHHGNGVKEVNSHHPGGIREHRGNIADRERGGIGCEDALRGHVFLQLAKHLVLDRKLLKHCLNNEVAAGKVTHGGCPGQHCAEFVQAIRVETTLVRKSLQFTGNPIDGVGDTFVTDVADNDRHLVAAKQLQRELPGHEPAADHANFCNR